MCLDSMLSSKTKVFPSHSFVMQESHSHAQEDKCMPLSPHFSTMMQLPPSFSLAPCSTSGFHLVPI